MNYEPAIDGLRAIAILAVLLFHLQPTWFKGGYIGVDIFFALSGYLITAVIVRDIRVNRFSIRNFYLRRVQRLLPNAVAMITVTVVFFAFLVPSSFSAAVANHGLWALANLSNFYVAGNAGGYWGDDAAHMPLLHTWSLAVEEQFYLLFPLLVLLLARFQILFPSLVFLALSSFFTMAFWSTESIMAAYYMLPTRAWQLLAGAALAAYYFPTFGQTSSPQGRSSNPTAGIGGLCLIFVSCIFLTESDGVPSWCAILPVFGTLLVLMSINGGTAPSFLSSGPAVAIGKLSYSLYLWHWPPLVVGRMLSEVYELPEWWPAVAFEAGLVFAIVAYFGIERPFRQQGTGRLVRLIFVGTQFSAGVAICLWCSRLPAARTAHLFDEVTFRGSSYLYQGLDVKRQRYIPLAPRYADVRFGAPPLLLNQSWEDGGIKKMWGGETPRVVVLGSSHALMYSALIDDVCRQQNISVSFLCTDTKSMFFDAGNDSEFDSARKKWLQEWQPDIVFAIDKWDRYVNESASGFSARLRRFVAEIKPYAGRVVLFTQVPVLRIGQTQNLREFAAHEFARTGQMPKIEPDGNEYFRQTTATVMSSLAQENPNVAIINANRYFLADDGSVHYFNRRAFFYTDDDHLSDAGAELVRDEVSLIISRLKDL